MGSLAREAQLGVAWASGSGGASSLEGGIGEECGHVMEEKRSLM